MARPKGYHPRPGENPGGRPSALQKNPKLLKRIAECFFLGFTDEQTASDCNISHDTIQRLRQSKFCVEVKRAELAREKIWRRKIWKGTYGWQGAAWFLERKYPTQFSRPEIQLQLNAQIGPQSVQNTIVLGPERASVLANRYEALERKANQLLKRSETVVDVEAVSVARPAPKALGNGG